VEREEKKREREREKVKIDCGKQQAALNENISFLVFLTSQAGRLLHCYYYS
jgi:hypothetical protein